MRRPLADELPERCFALARGEKEIETRICLLASSGERTEDLPFEKVMKRLDRSVADAVDGGSPTPVLYESFHLAPARVTGDRVLAQRAQQHLAPAPEEQRPVVQLDSHHVVRGGPFDWSQRVADLPSAGAVGISAVAQSLEHFAVHDARVGGPQSSRGWINDPRIFVRAQPPIPAVGTVRPRCWDLPIEADPPWNFSRDRPGDVALGVRTDEVLGRDSRPLRYLRRLIHVLGALQPSQA